MYFAVANDPGGRPSWWLHGSSGQVVASAGESFESLAHAYRAAQSFKTGAKTAQYEIYAAEGGSWRWRAWRSSYKVASSGESFYSQVNARRAAANVRDGTGSATGP